MPTIPTVSWAETSPAGSDNISQGDDRIRELKTQIREVIDVDHDFPSSGQATDVGQHKQVTLQEKADIGTGAVGVPILGAQTVSGKPELIYTNEDDTDIQITTTNFLNGAALINAGAIQNSTLKAAIINLLYPVGSVYTNYSDSTNPGTLFGTGTWTAIAGRVVVGLDAGQTEFDSAGETGGSKTHTLTTDEIPAHTHTFVDNSSASAGSGPGSGATQSTENKITGSTGGGGAHNNLQPYVVCYVWRRTA